MFKEVESAKPRARGVKNAVCASAAGYGGLWSHCLIHFYVYKGGDTHVMVDTSDSNGYITDFEWDRRINGDVDYTSTIPQLYRYFEPNEADSIAVRGKDDDGIWSEWVKFCVYPDAPPPAPTVYAIAPTADSISIYWKNKDVKDGDLTEYRVLVHQGAEPDSTVTGDIVSDWKSGYRIDTTEGYGYFFRFKTLTPSMPKVTYFYQVHARDARGSVNADAGNHTFSY